MFQTSEAASLDYIAGFLDNPTHHRHTVDTYSSGNAGDRWAGLAGEVKDSTNLTSHNANLVVNGDAKLVA